MKSNSETLADSPRLCDHYHSSYNVSFAEYILHTSGKVWLQDTHVIYHIGAQAYHYNRHQLYASELNHSNSLKCLKLYSAVQSNIHRFNQRVKLLSVWGW